MLLRARLNEAQTYADLQAAIKGFVSPKTQALDNQMKAALTIYHREATPLQASTIQALKALRSNSVPLEDLEKVEQIARDALTRDPVSSQWSVEARSKMFHHVYVSGRSALDLPTALMLTQFLAGDPGLSRAGWDALASYFEAYVEKSALESLIDAMERATADARRLNFVPPGNLAQVEKLEQTLLDVATKQRLLPAFDAAAQAKMKKEISLAPRILRVNGDHPVSRLRPAMRYLEPHLWRATGPAAGYLNTVRSDMIQISILGLFLEEIQVMAWKETSLYKDAVSDTVYSLQWKGWGTQGFEKSVNAPSQRQLPSKASN